MIAFDQIQFPDHARVWIYQADRKLSVEEQEMIKAKGAVFTSSWAAHGHELTAECHIMLDHFILILLDENVESASGCSIDKSVKFILDLQRELNINFTNRLISAIWKDDSLKLLSYPEVKQALENGDISATTLVFDNTITDFNDLKNNWLKPLNQTWLKKLLAVENVQ